MLSRDADHLCHNRTQKRKKIYVIRYHNELSLPQKQALANADFVCYHHISTTIGQDYIRKEVIYLANQSVLKKHYKQSSLGYYVMVMPATNNMIIHNNIPNNIPYQQKKSLTKQQVLV